MARQLVTPNFNVTETAGWCLRFSDKVFGLKAVYSTAWEAWTNTKFKHEDRNFPQGVAVPVWFDWVGDVGSGKRRYGHVAVRAADGKIWSSPLSGTGRAWFATVDDLIRAFGNGMRYVGWSEDISNVRVVEIGEEMIQDTDQEYSRWRQLAYQIRGRALSRDEFRQSAVGKTWLNTIEILSDDAEAHIATHAQEVGQVAVRDDWEGQINGLLKQLHEMPHDTSEAEQKLQAIKDALGIK